MITTVTNFTDQHGLTHEAPVFAVSHANLNKYASKNARFNEEDGSYSQDSSENTRIEYSVIYWPSEQHQLDDKEPLTYRDENDSEFLSFETEDDQMPIVEQAETHFLNTVIPNATA